MPTYHRAAAVGPTGPNDLTHLQIWNPFDSGVCCVIARMGISGEPQGFCYGITRPYDPADPYDAMLPTKPYAHPQGIESGAGNEALGKCELRLEGRPSAQVLGQMGNSEISNDRNPYYYEGKIIIPPGFGLTIRSDRAGFLRAEFAWDEVAKI